MISTALPTYVDGPGVVDDRVMGYFEVEQLADGGYGFRDAPPFVFDVAGLVRGRQTQEKRNGSKTLHLDTSGKHRLSIVRNMKITTTKMLRVGQLRAWAAGRQMVRICGASSSGGRGRYATHTHTRVRPTGRHGTR